MNPTPEHFEPAPLPRASTDAAAAGMTWAHDVIVLGSIALTALAVYVLARAEFGASTQIALPLSVAVLAGASALHLIFRRQVEPEAIAAAPDDFVVPKAQPTPVASTPVTSAAPHRQERAAPSLNEPRLAMPPHAALPETEQSERERVANLQAMIAELARTVPGPRAQTPDPDLTTARSAGSYPATAPAMSTHDLQQAALASAAGAMRSTLPAERSLATEIADSLAAGRIATYLEPIQALGQQLPQHYELSIRLRDADGHEMPDGDVKDTARRHGLLPQLDAALLPRAARVATHLHNRGRRSDILSTVDAISITADEFQTGLDMALAAAPASTIVLSFSQNDVRHFVPAHWQALATMAHMGCRFAIEDVFDLDLDFETLKAHGFDFVKLDAEVLLAGLPAPSGLIPPDDLCRYLTTIGYGIIVGHIDDDMTCARVLGFGALFGQGRLFGGKRAVRAEAVNTASAA